MNRADLEAAAEASLEELGLEAPEPVAPVRTHSQRTVAHAATDSAVLSQAEVDSSVEEAVEHVHTMQMRKAALKLAGEDDAVADALATAEVLPGALVTRMHDAIRPLQAQVERDVQVALALRKEGRADDSLAGTIDRQISALRETQRTLAELAGISELVPSTLDDRLNAVEELRVRVAGDRRRLDEVRAQRAAAEREAEDGE